MRSAANERDANGLSVVAGSVVAAANAPETHALTHYLAPLTALMGEGVTEVCVNRPHEAWLEGRQGWVRVEMPELGLAECKRLAVGIANYNVKGINADSPYLSGTLPGKERVQVVIPPACSPGTVSITIRKPSMVDKTLEELEAEGSFEGVKFATGEISDVDRELLALRREVRIREFLDLAVRSHKNILLAGATGSGKTTVMKSLAQRIPHAERVITIEDAHEMFMTGFPNKVHLFYQAPKLGQPGPQCTAQDALKSCLRMKPDRILLAELRGDEAWNYMDSLNTGHPGSLSSLHANSALDAIYRLADMIKGSPAGLNLDPAYVQQRCFQTIDVVLFYKHRRLMEIFFDPERRIESSRMRKLEAA